MRIVLLCNAQPNQVALANKIAAGFNLVGIVVEKKKANKAKKYTLSNIISKLTHKIRFYKIIRSWWTMLEHYKQRYPVFPVTSVLEVNDINDNIVKDFILSMQADLVMVSGTSMIKNNILAVPLPVGMINLHTGLSPYIKGAPNCTNWCIANNEFHLIGNTVMWIDAGIDSGDLLTTAIVGFSGNEDLTAIHIKVMEEAHGLYMRALRAIAENKAPRIRQDSIAKGVTYYAKAWNYAANRNLLKNLKHFSKAVNSPDYLDKIKQITTVSLSNG